MFLFRLQVELFETEPQTEYKEKLNKARLLLLPFLRDFFPEYQNDYGSYIEDTSSETSSSSSIEFFNADPSGVISESLHYLIARLTVEEKEPTKSISSDYRLGRVSIEGFDNNGNMEKVQQKKQDGNDTVLPVVSGYTELSYGILHLFRDKEPLNDAFTPGIGLDLTIVSVLAVPVHLTPADFLQFVGPFRKKVSHFRLLRDSQLNRYLVLMKFRQSSAAKAFFDAFNGKQFNSVEPEKCHIVFVKDVQIQSSTLPSYVFPSVSVSGGKSSSSSALPSYSGTLKDGSVHPKSPTDDMYELPLCPVCLERMDAAVSGILTTLCHHTFHCHCLRKWSDSRCPVCRYSQANPLHSGAKSLSADSTHNRSLSDPNEADATVNRCAVCNATENLWICLICGNIGCGRYLSAHAQSHFVQTQHLYSMELETQRVWDYAGDGYVHRLIQNRDDGKLVELPPSTADETQSYQFEKEKMDALGLEFSYLLTSSLESQRMYYENLLENAIKEATFYQSKSKILENECDDHARYEHKLMNEIDQLNNTVSKLKDQVQDLNTSLEAKQDNIETLQKQLNSTKFNLQQQSKELESIKEKLEEEESISRSLRLNQKQYTDKIKQYDDVIKGKQNEIEELNAQVTDLMAYFEMQDKVEEAMKNESSESGRTSIREGNIVLGQGPSSTHRKKTKKKR
ncbi:hypothetical protein MP638_005007 [Amoeboaphelidium occidentale]|nr:hypothetical protein MP638_005007 [Amoeboaphelidium occidentale]